jgi:hypothetical protein
LAPSESESTKPRTAVLSTTHSRRNLDPVAHRGGFLLQSMRSLDHLPRCEVFQAFSWVNPPCGIGRRCQIFGRVDHAEVGANEPFPPLYGARFARGLSEAEYGLRKWTGRNWRVCVRVTGSGRFSIEETFHCAKLPHGSCGPPHVTKMMAEAKIARPRVPSTATRLRQKVAGRCPSITIYSAALTAAL